MYSFFVEYVLIQGVIMQFSPSRSFSIYFDILYFYLFSLLAISTPPPPAYFTRYIRIPLQFHVVT